MLRTALFTIALLALTAGQAGAMQFSTILNGLVLFGEGAVIPGDAQRLRQALIGMPEDEAGMKYLALSSEGGDVAEAYRVAAVIDQVGVVTLIPNNAACVSACSLIWIAGDHRLMGATATLGFHSCHDAVTREPLDRCNDEMATFAMRQGIAYGTIAAFTTLVSPDGMLVLDKTQADCWELTKYPPHKTPENYGKCLAELFRDAAAEYNRKHGSR